MMETILAIAFIMLPTIGFGIWHYIDYENSPRNLVSNLTAFKTLFIFIMLSYSAWTFNNGADDFIGGSAASSLKLKMFIISYIFPGIAFSLIIFPNTSSEVLGTYQMFSKFGEHKKLTQIIGILLLLFSFIYTFFIFPYL